MLAVLFRRGACRSVAIPWAMAVLVGYWLSVPATLVRADEPGRTTPPVGLRNNTPRVDALVGGKIVISPGRTLESGTLVLRDGVIVAVGPKVPIPADATVSDMTGRTIYPGFLDSYSEQSPETDADIKSGGYWNGQVTPQRTVSSFYQTNADELKKLRKQGVVAQLVAPADGILKGTSLWVTTADGPLQHNLLEEPVALHAQLRPDRGSESKGQRQYPTSPMGAVALVRQALYDARWHQAAWQTFRTSKTSVPRPERNTALQALATLLESGQPLMIDAPDELYLLRAHRVAEEFKVPVIVRGSGREYRRLDAVVASGLPVVVPLNFPKAPYVKSPELAQAVTLERLMHWDLAPENPARLANAGVPILLTSFGLKSRDEFLKQIRYAVYRGLDPAAALAALTVTPAKVLGLDNRLGSLEVGKSASLIVTDGDIFADNAQLLETWIDGIRYQDSQIPSLDVRGSWELTVSPQADKAEQKFTLYVGGKPDALSGRIESVDPTVKLSSISLQGTQLNGVFEKDTLGVLWNGAIQHRR